MAHQASSSSGQPTRTALSDVLFLYTTRTEDPFSLSYEVECTALSVVNFTLNFDGSENFRVIPSEVAKEVNQMKLSAKVRPFQRVPIGKVAIHDDDKRASLRMGCSWSTEDPSETEMAEFMRVHKAKINKVLEDAKKLDFPSQLDDPKNKVVRDRCLQYGKKFVDLDFAPNETSLYDAKKDKHGVSQGSATSTHRAVEWKRPEEFMKGEVKVFFDGIAAGDIRQGALGDCWFLSALAALTEFPALIEALYPEESRDAASYGSYLVKFCKNGLWTTVRVDDFFPCYPGAGPIYSRCNGNELWVLLAEKAYAKLHGSYDAIRSGWAYEGMMDLTGAPCMNVRLDDPLVKPRILNGELWSDLVRYDMENYVMSASTPGEDEVTETGKRQKNATGLVAGHAYTMIAAKNTSKGDRIVKLRNPWGQMEWTGDWSDTSSKWTEEMQNEVERLVNSDDGSFWMSFEDLLKYFYSINICMVRYPGLNKKPWKETRRRFFFDYESLEDDDNVEKLEEDHVVFRITSPVYALHVVEKGLFIVSVHQQDTRCAGSKSYIDIGVSILRADPVYNTFQLITGSGNSADRQNQTDDIELEPGKYLVVPTTSGCKLRQAVEEWQHGKSDSTANRVPLTKKGENGTIDFSAEVIRAYTELFARMDVDTDGYLNKPEIDQYMLRTEGSTIEEPAYQWLLHNFENKDAPGLSCSAFIHAQLHVFRTTGCDEEKLWEEFRLLGYDNKLQLRTGRASTLSVHATSEYRLDSLPYDENAVFEAQELAIIMKGERRTFEDGKIKLYTHRSGYYGVSILVENCHHVPLVFQLDCSESVNVVSHRSTLVHKEMIPPNQKVVMHHLMPKDALVKTWSWAYSASYLWDEDMN